MCRCLRQRANRFVGTYNYSLNFICSAYLSNMSNGEWFSHVRELRRTGETVVDNWKIIKCEECGLAYVYDPSIPVCHHCPKRYKKAEQIHTIDTKRKDNVKRCAECGKIFRDTSSTLRVKYCSDECRKEARKRHEREFREKRKAKKGLKNAKISECTGNTRNQTNRRCG